MKKIFYLSLFIILNLSCKKESQISKDYDFVSSSNDKASASKFLFKQLPLDFYFGMTKDEVRQKADSLVSEGVLVKDKIEISDVFHRELYTRTSYNYLIESNIKVPILMDFENNGLKMFGYYFTGDDKQRAKNELRQNVKNTLGEASYSRKSGILENQMFYWYKDNLRVTFGEELLIDALIYYNFHNTNRGEKDFLEFSIEEILDYKKEYYEKQAQQNDTL